jgi:hypothetical protein
MPETGASGSVGAPLEQSEGATRQRRLPTGFAPFIPFARLTFAPPSAQRVAVTFSFEKVVLFSC